MTAAYAEPDSKIPVAAAPELQNRGAPVFESNPASLPETLPARKITENKHAHERHRASAHPADAGRPLGARRSNLSHDGNGRQSAQLLRLERVHRLHGRRRR